MRATSRFMNVYINGFLISIKTSSFSTTNCTTPSRIVLASFSSLRSIVSNTQRSKNTSIVMALTDDQIKRPLPPSFLLTRPLHTLSTLAQVLNLKRGLTPPPSNYR